jgi:hypothetical protein
MASRTRALGLHHRDWDALICCVEVAAEGCIQKIKIRLDPG